MPTRRIAFICPVRCDPREQRRGASLRSLFDAAVAICYDRGFYTENRWREDIELVLLSKAIDGDHLRRLQGFPRALAQARRAVRSFNGPQVIYGFGLESGIIANLTRRPGDLVIWEIADLPAASMKQRWKRFAVGMAEKWVILRSDHLVMTSRPMFEAYYDKKVPSAREKLIIVENRLADTFKPYAGTTKERASFPLRLGWSGFLRNVPLYERLLVAVAKDGGRSVSLGIWGGGPGSEVAARYARQYSNIAYHGTYEENPGTLRRIHLQTDVHIVLDDGANLNVQNALPNRLFYCLAYETPLLVTAGTAKETRVDELGVGMGVDEKHVDWTQLFQQLSDGVQVNQWLAKLKSVPDEMRYMDSQPLIKAIQEWKETSQ